MPYWLNQKTLWHADEFSNTGNINVKILTCCNLQVNHSHSFFTSQVSTFSYDEMFPVICKLELFKNRYTLTSKVYNLRPTITHRSANSISSTYLHTLETLFLGYFGALGRDRVLGLLKWTEGLNFLFLLLWTPRSTAFLAFTAFSAAFGGFALESFFPPPSFLAAGLAAGASTTHK